MYTNDKNHRLTLRLNDDQFDFVRMNAEQLDVSPSEFLRMVINSSMFAWREMKSNENLKSGISEIAEKYRNQEGIGRENDEANQHSFV